MARWLSKPAVLWALDDAPDVPARLVAALVAVARYADENGCGAHPSALTVAAVIRKTERTAKKDLAELRRLGLLLPGDQRIVKDIRADRRPFVYDLPMPRGVADDTPPDGQRGVTQDTPPGSHGVSQTVGRGVAERQNGVSHRTPEEVLKTSRTRARDASGADAPRALARKPPRTAACRSDDHEHCPRAAECKCACHDGQSAGPGDRETPPAGVPPAGQAHQAAGAGRKCGLCLCDPATPNGVLMLERCRQPACPLAAAATS